MSEIVCVWLTPVSAFYGRRVIIPRWQGVIRRQMAKVDFNVMTGEQPAIEVLAMMRALYIEDAPASKADHQRFHLTIERLLAEPSSGRIIIFSEGAAILGYALLIPFWSNEFGGTLLFVDELFVKPDARNRGIAHSFFEYLASERPFDPVALALEVSPENERARRLYESIGFERRRNTMFTYGLA